MQMLPNSIRGMVLGLGACAPDNISAMYICFGNTPSLGIPFALGRAFIKVTYVLHVRNTTA